MPHNTNQACIDHVVDMPAAVPLHATVECDLNIANCKLAVYCESEPFHGSTENCSMACHCCRSGTRSADLRRLYPLVTLLDTWPMR